jgi:type VI secretion system protein ImpA
MSSVVQTASTAASSPVIDIEPLLAPVSADNPTGESLQYSGLYDEIREARRSEDALEQGDWKRDTKVADWPEVVNLATSALSSQTKDLQIGAWLAEALVKLYGFPGLREALAFMHGLHEQYWDGIYPEEDEGDLEARANALSLMDRQVAIAMKEVPITGSASGYSCTLIDFDNSTAFNVGPDVDSETAEARRQQAASENKVTSEDWLKAKQSTPRAFYETLYADLNQCWELFLALDRVMDERFGRQTPGLGALKNALDQVRSIVERIVKEKRVLEPDPLDGDQTAAGDESQSAAGNNGSGSATAVGAGGGPIRTRADAINRLRDVAAFFRKTEPQSPVSYLAERAVKWSQMPLESWLASVIKDPNVLDSLRETLGVDGQAREEPYQEEQ